MKVPKVIRTFCPRCLTHQKHTVKIFKKGKPRITSWGERQHKRLLKGYGSTPRGKQKQVKTTKKQSMLLKCEKCGYVSVRKGVRLRKMEVASK